MTSTRRPLITKKRLGIFLVLLPFIVILIAGVWLYLWILYHGYDDGGNVMFVWLLYAVSGLAYLWPAFIGISVFSIGIGISTLLRRRT